MCTLIKVKALDGSIIVARNEDLGNTTPLPNLSFIPKGFIHKAALPEKDNPLTWETEYAYCGADFGGYPCYIYEGVNDSNLAVSSLYLPYYTDYKTDLPHKNPNYISSLELAPWVLANFKDIPDFLTNGLPKLRSGEILIKSNNAKAFPQNPQHLGLIDDTGSFLVLEFAITSGGLAIKEYPQVHDNKIGVLTNSPPFEWHMINLHNYVNLRSVTPPSVQIGGQEIFPASGSAGMLGLPGDFMPASRFVRMAYLLNNAPPPRTAEEAVTLAFQLLGNVSVPDGAVRSPAAYQPSLSRTIFSVAKDITNQRFYWKTYPNPNIAMVDYGAVFKKMSKSKDQSVRAIPLGTKKIPAYTDLTKDLENLTYGVNKNQQVMDFRDIYAAGGKLKEGYTTLPCEACPTPGFPEWLKQEFGIPDK